MQEVHLPIGIGFPAALYAPIRASWPGAAMKLAPERGGIPLARFLDRVVDGRRHCRGP